MSATATKISVRGPITRVELDADSTIKPGMLVERTATGVRPQNTSVGFHEWAIAEEDSLQGNIVSTAYAAADKVQIAIQQRGNLVNGLMKAGYNYTKGMQVFPYGDGTFRPTTGTPKQLSAIVEEALDLSASGAVDTLCLLRVV